MDCRIFSLRTSRTRPLVVLISALAWWLVIGFSPVAHAAGASLKISPTGGVYQVGALVDVSFILDTGGEAVNAISADILFPADKLQIVNPAASTSFITVWVTAPTFSNTDGTLSFQGGIPNPGVKTSSGVISTVTFRVKSAGKATIKYAPTSKVLRNDGEGTNILTSTGVAEYVFDLPPPEGPLVNSPTHGDQNQWYNNSLIQFGWEPITGAKGYSYTFDQTAKGTPDTTIDTDKTAVSVDATSDGIWYFHVRALTESWGGTTSYPVHIDVTPPAAFEPKLDKSILTIEETGTLRFITTDAASGIDHYEVKQVTKKGTAQGNTLFVEVSSPYITPKLSEGEYEFIVRALDRAGNSTEGTAGLNVVAGGVPFYARVPFLKNPAVANTALIVLSALTLMSVVVFILRRVRIRSTFQRDLVALERDARKKAASLERELHELHEAERFFHDELRSPPPPPVTMPRV